MGKFLLGDLNKLHYYFNGGLLMRTDENGYQSSKLRVGRYSFIGDFVSIGPNTESIGDFCSIAPGVSIGSNMHPIDQLSTSAVFYASRWGEASLSRDDEYNNQPTIIGHDVWIGNNAVIMPGVTLGTGCIVGSAAVVTKDVKPFEIVVGIPAIKLRSRFDKETRDRVLKSKWWEMNIRDAINYYNEFSQVKE